MNFNKHFLKTKELIIFDKLIMTSLANRFHDSDFETLDINDWDVSNVINLDNCFGFCKMLKALDLSKWNISNVKDLEYCFRYCISLESLNIAYF